MKINLKELQNIYSAYISEKIPISRKNCPPLRKIISSFKKGTSEKQKTKLLDHVTNCYFCAREFQLILNILRNEKKLKSELKTLLFPKNSNLSINKPSKGRIFRLREKEKPLILIINWKYLSLFIGTVIIILSVIFFKNQTNKEIRGIDSQQIHLLEPLNEEYSKSQLMFTWNEFKGSNYYLLEIFDETLIPIWKSNKIITNFNLLPDKIVQNLKSNKTYFWMVTAFLPNGRKVESNLQKFILLE
ncbi:MAG: hypothetical protein OEW87_05940 [Flavobacteriaceae bacterium]|nr:hypothetical protein [Flavobacteriaceae bacterium]